LDELLELAFGVPLVADLSGREFGQDFFDGFNLGLEAGVLGL
jgi:hypothetical protein